MVHYRVRRDPKSSHQQILKLVRELQRSPILDVGAAQGFLGSSIKDTGLTIDAIEANAEWAEMARPNYRNVWTCYAENAPLEARPSAEEVANGFRLTGFFLARDLFALHGEPLPDSRAAFLKAVAQGR